MLGSKTDGTIAKDKLFAGAGNRTWDPEINILPMIPLFYRGEFEARARI